MYILVELVDLFFILGLGWFDVLHDRVRTRGYYSLCSFVAHYTQLISVSREQSHLKVSEENTAPADTMCWSLRILLSGVAFLR